MSGKIVLTIEFDAPEAEILIAALRDQAVLKRENSKVSAVLDRIAYDLEEQAG